MQFSKLNGKGLAVVTAGAALAVTGVVGGTFALWSDSAEVAGTTITAGNLDIEHVETQSGWYDVSVEGEAKPIDIGAFRTVPTDILEYRAGLAVALDGDNLKAKLKISAPESTGGLLKENPEDTAGMNLTYQIFKADENGAPTGEALASGEVVEGVTEASVDLTPEEVDLKEIPTEETKANYVATIRAEFDENTPDQNRVKETAVLSEITASLLQVK